MGSLQLSDLNSIHHRLASPQVSEYCCVPPKEMDLSAMPEGPPDSKKKYPRNSWGHKEQRAWSYARRGLLAKYLVGVSVTTEVLSGGKWLLHTMALWP